MSTKLILIEGLPGSGKSTTARIVHDILKDKGINVELFSEGDYNHPADYDGVAYFNNEAFNNLQQSHFKSWSILENIKIKHCNGYLIPFRKAIEEQAIPLGDELFKDITKNDIYELPIGIHTNLILNRWSEFVNHYINEDKVVIFECCFIQNPVTVSMIKNNSPKDTTMSYIHSLAEIIASLNPVLIYVEQKDIKVSFNRVINERPKEWLEGFIHYYTNQGYGLNNDLKKLDGVIQILEARRNLEHEIYESLTLTKYTIDNSDFDLNLHKEKINYIFEKHLNL
ncbi:MAG: hypothetical protein ACREV6_13140 [Clostridium sp.]|uniref:hypothetical protein n=1 Tax=Clostridium sp. TaxID=1506 RepID=UPI003D6CA3E8